MSEHPEPEEISFRANKRRKVFRKRALDGTDDDTISSEPSNLESRNGGDQSDGGTGLTQIMRKRPFVKRQGMAFTANDTRLRAEIEDKTETAIALREQSNSPTQIGRFTKPSGRVGVVQDKHLTAYVDSKLAELVSNQAPSAREAHQQGDLVPPATTTSAHMSVIESHPSTIAPVPRDPTVPTPGPIQPLPRSETRSPKTARRRRPQEPDASALARAAMVESVFQESQTSMYDRSKPLSHLPQLRSTTDSGDSGVDNDEALAEAFKAQFLQHLTERNRRRPPPPPAARGATTSSGVAPKLGGSRSQREKMRVAAEEAKGSKTNFSK